MDESAKTAIKEAVFAEYAAMRMEIRDRVVGQGRVAAGGVALVGGFIGVLAAVRVEANASLVATLLAHDKPASLHVFAFLCAGFVLGIELLLGFWTYQLFAMFRICGYVKQLETHLKNTFSIPAESFVLSWDRYSAGMADVHVPNEPWLVRRSLQVVSYVQPLSFFVLGGLGLLGVAAGAWANKGALIAVFAALLVGLICIGLVMLGLHKWAGGAGYRPHAGMGGRPTGDRSAARGGGVAAEGDKDK